MTGLLVRWRKSKSGCEAGKQPYRQGANEDLEQRFLGDVF